MDEPKSKVLLIDPCAWAKMKWFMKEAGKLEMTGFGITEKGHPLHVIDFQTIEQEVTGALTTLDDVALAKYVGENAKKGIEPARCMRVWVHSHPFVDGTPSPSGIDTTNLRTKFMNEVDWAVMVILGKGGCLAELHAKLQMPGDIVVAIPLVVKIDWMMKLWGENKEEWKKEYKAHVKEEEKAIDVGVIGNTVIIGQGYSGRVYDERGKNGDRLYQEWCKSCTPLNLRDYIWAVKRGYTAAEVARWGFAVLDESLSPKKLRAAEARVLAKHHDKRKERGKKGKNRVKGSTASMASLGLKVKGEDYG